MKLLLTGASGFAGCHLAKALAPGRELTGTHLERPVSHAGMHMQRLDLGDRAQVERVVESVRPDVVVHTAALSKTGDCEKDPEGATRANALGTRHLVEALESHCPHAHLVHFSTDLVYAGTRANWSEQDPVSPVMHYGHTKLAAERSVEARGGAFTILRVALMYGPATPWAGGATSWLVDAIRAGEALTLYSDEYRTPVHIDDVVAAVQLALAAPEGLGLLNCGGSERVSRVEMGQVIADALGASRELIEVTTLAEAALDAPRAADVSMDSSRLCSLLGRPTLGFEEGVERLLASSN